MAAKTEKPKKTPVAANVDADTYNWIEGYAFGTRRKKSDIVIEALAEYYQNHKDQIDARIVPPVE